MPLRVSAHPVVQHCLAGLRDSTTQPEEFRVLARRVRDIVAAGVEQHRLASEVGPQGDVVLFLALTYPLAALLARSKVFSEGRFILGSPQQCYEQLQPYWKEFGVNHIVIRTHWAGMPLSTALASMRLISDELLPALHKV